MDKISKKINTLLKRLNIEKYSLLDIYPNDKDLYDFINYQKNNIKDIVCVTDNEFYFTDDLDYKKINIFDWENNTIELAKKFKGSIIIYHETKLLKEGLIDLLEEFSKYFPLIFIFNNEILEVKGWASRKLYDNLYIYMNKNINKFDNFEIKNFQKLINENEEISEIDEETFNINLNESDNIRQVTNLLPKTELDLSMFDNLPSPTITPNVKNKTFIQEFYTYLKLLISRILPKGKEDLLPFILNKKTIINIWIPSMTHVITEDDPLKNYETYEKIGDMVQGMAFFNYFLNRFPSSTPDEINNVRSSVLKTEHQLLYTKKMKLNQWAFIPEKLRDNQKIEEDLFEAFTGALDRILNEKSNSLGQSINIVYYIFDKVYKNYDFSDAIKKPEKNYVLEVIPQIRDNNKSKMEETYEAKRPTKIPINIWEEILDKGNEILKKNDIYVPLSIHKNKEDRGIDEVIFNNKDSKINIKVILNDYGSNMLKKRGINIKKGTVIGEATESTKRPANTKAYQKAKEYLEKKGITKEWIEEIKMSKVEEHIDNLDLVLQKAKKQNPKIYRVTVKAGVTLKKDQLFQIIGIEKNNHKKHVLYVFVSDDKARDNYQLAVDEYLDNF